MRRAILIYAVFLLSGAAGLIYEIVWARQLVLVFGNTTQAVSAILTGFFGGMAIGSVVGGRIADRVASPLRLYGLLEVALVAVVLVTPVTFGLIHEVYRGAYGALEGQPQALALVRFGLALLALGPATVMMGATLPSLTRHLTRGGGGDRHLSRAFGRLYAMNTLGAIVGTLVSGFVLIELVGLTGTLVIGASCSGIAGAVALLLARGDPRRAPGADEPPTRSAAGPVGDAAPRPGLALAVAFVSGLTSLGYQTLWTRLLASGTGSSTYVFTAILGLFLVGLAVGAFVFTVLRSRVRNWVAVLALCQLLVATLALIGGAAVLTNVPPIDPDELAAVLLSTAAAVVLPTTIVMGLALPASAALLDSRAGGVATSAGRLLAVNTAGALCATFLIPFVVIPAIGSPSAVALLALVNVATAMALALTRTHGPLRPVLAGAAVLVGGATVGALVVPGVIVDPSIARIDLANGSLDASAEDEIASVQAGRLGAQRHLWVGGTSMTLLTVDARLMPVMPLIARPESDSALTVAFGMGSAFRTALVAGLETDAVELVPSVVAMFGQFYPDAEAVLADPRGRVIVADGRNHVELTDRRYDIIVTDPPPPVESSGVSVISSFEYYRAARRRLTDGGVMMQWVPYGQTIEEFRAHVRTFDAVFPEVTVAFGPGGYGFFMLGSDRPIELREEAMRDVLERPGVLEDLSGAYDSPESTVEGWVRRLRGLIWIEGDEVARFAGDGPLITDDRPLPEYFLLRRTFSPSPDVTPGLLLGLTSQP